MYIRVRNKFIFCYLIACLWAILSIWISIPWLIDLAILSNWFWSIFIIFGLAIIPGFMNAFLAGSLLFDKRPSKKQITTYPPLTILIAAFNEEDNITSTIVSIDKQEYTGQLTVIVIDDGSTDNTVERIKSLTDYSWLQILPLTTNQGKAQALNAGLQLTKTELVITIDADCYLFKNALNNIVSRYLSDPSNTAAVAGCVLVRNSRLNFVTRAQEWDYFLGIAAVKRVQSLFQGTLVAQGAFSLYQTNILNKIGGWRNTVGEDIVLTWDLLSKNYRIGFCEDAYCFTNAPTSWRQFIKQRQRWSRGLIESFKYNWRLLFKPRLITLLIWWNLFFPYLDLVYTLFFIPGIILAFFGIYWIAGPLTFILIPMAMIVNYIIFREQIKTFRSSGLKIRKNILGLIFYTLFYSMVLQPASVVGYIKEVFLGRIKNWGTK